jgi:serine/threonine protein kinase
MPAQANQPLPAGYVLNGYRIEKPLSSGGFSIVYLARDEAGTPFAIKEYLPSTMPLRTEGVEVLVTDEGNLSLFRHGLKCFFEEGRALAMISHPNVVRVENFFRANETCYMVMQYVRGRTLQFHIQRNRSEFTEGFIRKVFMYLMNGLREVHANKLLHLDIKPANIFLSMEGRPVLLDFGAARITLSEEAMKLKPMYTAGFAAPEHYRFKPGELGPWSDIYSVGATMYTCIAGTPPQAGDQREQKDRMIPLRTLARQPYSDDLFSIVESCLAVDYLKRPQTAFDLQKLLMEAPEAEDKSPSGFLETLSTPLSKLFSR